MKKNLALIASALLGICSAWAAPLQPGEALSRAISDNPARKRAYGGGGVELVYTAKSQTLANTNCFYIFNRNSGGYLIVTADDCLPALIGYSDEGCYNPNNVPPQMKWWLDGKASEISEFYAAGGVAPESPRTSNPRTANWQNISPLLTCKWDQDDPYWNQCPMKSGSRCYTGCVATAMAQVMYYHKWPEQGKGSHTYYWSGGNRNLSCDFSLCEFDWDVMTDIYNRNSSTAAKEEVAELMYACGVSVDMIYGNANDGGSGAYSDDIPGAMIDYFDYDKGAKYVTRARYSDSKWQELIYTELSEGRPVLYGGDGTNGGHQFVCDGYRSSDGYFHFNWGWSGESDGYFKLDALNPPSLGAGGGAGGFNRSQDAVIGVKRPEGAKPVFKPDVASYGNFTLASTIGNTYTFEFTDDVPGQYGLYSIAIEDFNAQFGVRIEADGLQPFYAYTEEFTLAMPNPDYTYYNSFRINIPDDELVKGVEYYAYPVILYNDKNYEVPVSGSFSDCAQFSPALEYDVRVENFTYFPFVAGKDTQFEFTVYNAGPDDFSGSFTVNIDRIDQETLKTSFETGIELSMNGVHVKAGESVNISRNITNPISDNGKFEVTFICDDKVVSAIYPMFAGYYIKKLSIPSKLNFDLLYDEEPVLLEPVITPENATWTLLEWGCEDETVAVVDSNGLVTPIAEGVTLVTVTTTDGTDITATCLVTVDRSVGVQTIPLEGLCDIYNLQGIAVYRNIDMRNITELPAGTYIIRTADRTLKINKK